MPHSVHAPPAKHRSIAPIGLFVLALFPFSCSGTHEQVQRNGDVVLRSGPTALGWVGVVAAAILVGAFLVFAAVAVMAITGEQLGEAARSRGLLPAGGALSAGLFAAGVIGLMGWGVAASTVLKPQATVVTASRGAAVLTSTRSRLIGRDEVRRWEYREIARIDFEYVPGSGGDDGSPPQGVVSVRTANEEPTQIFDGSVCPARQ